MNTQPIKNSRKRFVSLTMAWLLTAVMSSSAFAIDLTAKGFLDLNSSNNPRLSVTSPQGQGMPCNSITALGTSSFAVKFVVYRDGVAVASDNSTTILQYSDSTPGKYNFIAVNNNNPSRAANIMLTLTCN
jgi:hypothetical protein